MTFNIVWIDEVFHDSISMHWYEVFIFYFI